MKGIFITVTLLFSTQLAFAAETKLAANAWELAFANSMGSFVASMNTTVSRKKVKLGQEDAEQVSSHAKAALGKIGVEYSAANTTQTKGNSGIETTSVIKISFSGKCKSQLEVKTETKGDVLEGVETASSGKWTGTPCAFSQVYEDLTASGLQTNFQFKR